MNILEDISMNIVKGHINSNSPYPPELKGQPGVRELVQKAVDEKLDISRILKEGLIAGMEEVGNRFSAGQFFVPEMLVSAQAMKSGLKILEPFFTAEQNHKLGIVIIGTVKGDLHDIGKNLVGMILEGGGFNVIDLGINVPPEKFVEKAQEFPEAVIGMSALLTTTVGSMKATVELLRAQGLTNRVIIGGAAVSERFASEIRAEGYTRDAAKAVPLIKSLLNIDY